MRVAQSAISVDIRTLPNALAPYCLVWPRIPGLPDSTWIPGCLRWFGRMNMERTLIDTTMQLSTWRSPSSRRKATVIFTNPDSTFLHRAPPCDAARRALRFLASEDIPLVLCSSRTRAELETIQQALDVHHPFICENGGALHLPRGYFPSVTDAAGNQGYGALPFGQPYWRVAEVLRYTADSLGIEVRGFNDMSVQEVADEWGISLAEARLAKLREHDEPFRLLSPDPAIRSRLFTALRRAGLHCVIGCRFHHVASGPDIGASLRTLKALYRLEWGDIRTVGVADGLVDAALLREVDVPMVVSNPNVDSARVLRKTPRARMTHATGGEGWGEAILGVVAPVPHHVSKRT
jgi:mannosyl-3-phosphoglycerate phosphatase